MSTDNRTLRRKLDIELPALEDCYLMLRDLKSDGALAGQSIPTILQYDDAVESIAAAMQHLRNVIDILGKSEGCLAAATRQPKGPASVGPFYFLTVHTVPSHHF